MKKLNAFLLVSLFLTIVTSCSKNDELNVEIYEEQYLLNSFELQKNAAGNYSIHYTTGKNVAAENTKNAKGNRQEIYLFKVNTTQKETSFSSPLVIQDHSLFVAFNDTTKDKRTTITVFDDAASTTSKESASIYLKSYDITNVKNNMYELSFSIKSNVAVRYEYNSVENIYEIHLSRDANAVEGDFTVTYEKEPGNALKIDFVNHIPTNQSKDEEIIERKPRVIIDTFEGQ